MGTKQGGPHHLSDVLRGREGPVPSRQGPGPSLCLPHPCSDRPAPAQHRHCGNPLAVRRRAAALGMLSVLSPSLSTRGNHCLGATVPAYSRTHTSLCSGAEVHSLPCGLRWRPGGCASGAQSWSFFTGSVALVAQSLESARKWGQPPATLALVAPTAPGQQGGRN